MAECRRTPANAANPGIRCGSAVSPSAIREHNLRQLGRRITLVWVARALPGLGQARPPQSRSPTQCLPPVRRAVPNLCLAAGGGAERRDDRRPDRGRGGRQHGRDDVQQRLPRRSVGRIVTKLLLLAVHEGPATGRLRGPGGDQGAGNGESGELAASGSVWQARGSLGVSCFGRHCQGVCHLGVATRSVQGSIGAAIGLVAILLPGIPAGDGNLAGLGCAPVLPLGSRRRSLA